MIWKWQRFLYKSNAHSEWRYPGCQTLEIVFLRKIMNKRFFVYTFLFLTLAGCKQALEPQAEYKNAVENTLAPLETVLSGLSTIMPPQIPVITTTPIANAKIININNLDKLVILHQWDVEHLSSTYGSLNFWFSDSEQFIVPVSSSSPMGGLLSFNVDNPVPLWMIESFQSEFAINEFDEVFLNTEGLNIYYQDGIKKQTIRTNNVCDYSQLSSYILTIPGTSMVVTGIQDSYHDFGLNNNDGDKARILLWDIENHTCSNLFDQFDGTIHSLSLSPDSRYLSYTIASDVQDSRKLFLHIYDLELREERCELKEGEIARFTTNGKLAVYEPRNRRIAMINPETCTEISTFDIGGEIINTFSISPNEKLMADVTSNSIDFWNLQTGEKIFVLDNQYDPLLIFGFSPDGKYLLTSERVDDSTLKGQVMLWTISDD